MPVEVGSQAPDFTLRNEDGEEVTLSSLRGQNVVVVFFPFAFSAMCTKELHDVTELAERFDAAGAQVLGVSVDSPFALKAFRNAEGIAAHLLSDFHPKGAVAESYGAYFGDLGFATRATFVIDKDGRVAHKQVTSLAEARDQAEVLAALASCPV
jgi:peroxiredoxin (alkyl hydroperoxide reductase subunit C)